MLRKIGFEFLVTAGLLLQTGCVQAIMSARQVQSVLSSKPPPSPLEQAQNSYRGLVSGKAYPPTAAYVIYYNMFDKNVTLGQLDPADSPPHIFENIRNKLSPTLETKLEKDLKWALDENYKPLSSLEKFERSPEPGKPAERPRPHISYGNVRLSAECVEVKKDVDMAQFWMIDLFSTSMLRKIFDTCTGVIKTNRLPETAALPNGTGKFAGLNHFIAG
jgi:hypothetical protein